ncbi:hypothetical protein [Porticoccus sp.]
MSQDASGGGQTRKTLIEELDELHFALHEGPEFQHDIPMLNEPYAIPENDNDIDIDIPILTDTCDDLIEHNSSAPVASDVNLAPEEMTVATADVTESADSDLERLLDEMVAEHLPKLEQKLRQRLREMIEQGQLDLPDNHVDAD